jgi:MerR family transcriptional regulator/heat shock protein HspR
VYIISVAAELAGVHPQTLRIYERKGLLTPARTPGNNRRYSERDIQRLQTIQRLTQVQGINLAGVKMIVEMEDQLDRMRRRMERLDRELEASVRRAKAELDRLHERHPRADIVTVSSVRPIRHAARQVGIRANVRPHDHARGPIEAGPGS